MGMRKEEMQFKRNRVIQLGKEGLVPNQVKERVGMTYQAVVRIFNDNNINWKKKRELTNYE